MDSATALMTPHNTEGRTALMTSFINGHTEVVKLLLAAGAAVDIVDNNTKSMHGALPSLSANTP
jgi:ankyrin repeat protein